MSGAYIRVGLDKASPKFAWAMHLGALNEFVDGVVAKLEDEKERTELLELELAWRSSREYY